MRPILRFLALVLLFGIPRVSAAPVHIVLVGDSTVTDNAGWGLGFRQFLVGGVEPSNTSRGERSSMSFIKEGRWEEALALKGDYYLIQFGHNDQPGKPGRSTTMEEYRGYLARYVAEAREAGATPVLVTPLVRREFKDREHPDHIVSSMEPWAETVRAVAKEKNVPLLELHDRSKELCEKMGRDGVKRISPVKPGGAFDGTHLNSAGYVPFGQLVAQELGKAVPALVPMLLDVPRDPNPLIADELSTHEYKRVGGEALLLDVCAPKTHAGAPLHPVVIVVHGGGWGSGDRKTMIRPVLETLTGGGHLYVSIDYRLSPKHRWPACREDVEDAVAWTKSHIRTHGGDPDRIALLGYSAGGQLAFFAALDDRPPHPVKALVGLAPTTDFLEDLGRRGGPSKSLRDLMNCQADESFEKTLLRLYQASPINHLHDGMPPLLLIHGTEDRSVPFQQSLHIQQKIADAKWEVPCEIHKIVGAPHRQSEWDKFDTTYKAKLLTWLGKHL